MCKTCEDFLDALSNGDFAEWCPDNNQATTYAIAGVIALWGDPKQFADYSKMMGLPAVETLYWVSELASQLGSFHANDGKTEEAEFAWGLSRRFKDIADLTRAVRNNQISLN